MAISKQLSATRLACSLLVLLVFLHTGVNAFSTLPATSTKTLITTSLPSSIAIPQEGGTPISPPVRLETPTVTKKEESSISNIRKLTGFSDLRSTLAAAPQNELTVVSFHASYCRVCRRAQIKYKKVVSIAPEKVQFTSFEASKIPAADLKSLGVFRFPCIQVWRNGQCVESLNPGASFSYIPKVMESIDKGLERSRTEWLDIAPQLQASQEALERLCTK
eukprot:CAMPEP_0194227282 /NCGR_PEP_ID=MMETSP0156-20130528/42778_1 /TAXON_ID=33649 /ORGANISM="Thalassionema nitzschioides, Strain L26-B" /LENGTH=219 /DNA_ID=CAMNT_0038959761 /DNA_START=17 /DNA_END=676 /DNA_ORIENTATION=+